MRTTTLVCVLTLLATGLAATGRASTNAPRPAGDATAQSTLDALGPGFTRSETAHFVLLSDGSAAWTRSTSATLEGAYDAMDRFMRRMGLAVSPLTERLLCVLIRDHDRFAAFASARDGVQADWMAGYYATQTNRIVFCDSSTSPDFAVAANQASEMERSANEAAELASRARRERRPEVEEAYRAVAARARDAVAGYRLEIDRRALSAGIAKTTHEAAHIIAFNRGLQSRSRQYPFWLSEGLATCFEATSAADARRGMMGPEHENPIRSRDFADAAARGTLVPLDAFVEMNAAPPDDGDAATIMYAQAHALFRWLYRYEREKLAGLFTDIAAEPPGYIAPRRQGELFRARFGDATRLERRWLRETVESAPQVAGAPVEP